MHVAEYTFTGFLPSGNVCSWYYDENKNTSFANSWIVDLWDREPKIGDKIKLIYGGYGNYDDSTLTKAFINNALVYERTPENSGQLEKNMKNALGILLKEKGFL